ncbi:MAG: PHP domain-containing protein [Clostridia bacterium]
MQLIDLHVHSTASDGTLTPTEVTNLALQCGLTAYALTDHDTVDGVAEAMQAAENTSLTVIPGAEFSSPYEGKEIHILWASDLEPFRTAPSELQMSAPAAGPRDPQPAQ